jgi:hypothetical protein
MIAGAKDDGQMDGRSSFCNTLMTQLFNGKQYLNGMTQFILSIFNIYLY